MPRSKSRISIETERQNRKRIWTKLFWTVHRKSRPQLLCPRLRSASYLLRCSCCLAWPDTSSCPSLKQSCSPCWLRTFFPGRSSQLWPSTCCEETITEVNRVPAATHCRDATTVLRQPLKDSSEALP